MSRSRLEITLDPTGRLDVDDYGHNSFYGHSSGIAFLARIQQEYGELLKPEAKVGTTAGTVTDLPHVFDPRQPFPHSQKAALPELPSKNTAEKLVNVTLENVCVLSHFVYRPSFDLMFDRAYDCGASEDDFEEMRFLRLLFAVMAVGSLAASADRNEHEHAKSAAFEYFLAAKESTDITNCRDMTSLQTIVFIVMFLQCSSRISECYTYLGTAIRSAFRMGLHRHIGPGLTSIDRQIRSRTFWVLRKMDIYVSAMLGLPSNISEDDIDQEFPVDIEDHMLHGSSIPTQPHHEPTQMTGTIAHVRLMQILQQVTKHVYAIKGTGPEVQERNRTYSVEVAKIRKMDTVLRSWHGDLPEAVQAPRTDSERLVSCLLKISYYHVRLLLYRPFVQYPLHNEPQNQDSAHEEAIAACLDAASRVVHTTQELKGECSIAGHWFALYATFFAVFSLVYMVLECPSADSAPKAFEDAKVGRELLTTLRDSSPIADTCAAALKTLFDRLPDTLAKRLGKTRAQSYPEYSPVSSTFGDASDSTGDTGSVRASYNDNSIGKSAIVSSFPANSQFGFDNGDRSREFAHRCVGSNLDG